MSLEDSHVLEGNSTEGKMNRKAKMVTKENSRDGDASIDELPMHD